MSNDVLFACGSKGNAEYCPGQCSYGRFCRLLKEKSSKPRAAPQAVPVIAPRKETSKPEETKSRVVVYY